MSGYALLTRFAHQWLPHLGGRESVIAHFSQILTEESTWQEFRNPSFVKSHFFCLQVLPRESLKEFPFPHFWRGGGGWRVKKVTHYYSSHHFDSDTLLCCIEKATQSKKCQKPVPSIHVPAGIECNVIFRRIAVFHRLAISV